MKKLLRVLSLTMLLVIAGVMLTACAPANLTKAKEKMEEKDYVIVLAEEYDEPTEDGMTAIFNATKMVNFNLNSITAYLFESNKAAKAYYESHVDKDDEEDSLLQLKGKWVYFGTEQAVEDFLG